ncbi:hypothetical protein LWI28_006778 [Acer negundo]|uniref:Alpha/beta hydrolase fold-3 domain-containing protein n=1 Tax=Acer negundo TaxID=4023 RepID=A0AAD5ICF3_ACENE|nr:hypothetical protein LWI28_006778 [Acer negundo]KAK4839068.1 hypothetical protein QYF36_018818 [Acer negundo]
MSQETIKRQLSNDPYQLLHIIPNPDGSITRNEKFCPTKPATPDPAANNNDPVLTKDVFINQSKNIWLRIFLPRQPLDHDSSSSDKLPLIVYFHGGGFIVHSPDMTVYHNFCSSIAVHLQAVVVSVNHRHAPEHRLPAAYDDAIEALHWIKTTQEDWLTKYVDFSNCFLKGSSAGGNLVYNVALRAAAAEVDGHDHKHNNLLPLKIRGLILHQPAFGGVKRTGSEIRLLNDRILPACVSDLGWELSLPLGADRDHEYCNPTVDGGSKVLDQIKSLGWKVMVTGCDGDPLIDRQIELVKIMDQKGVQVVGHFDAGGFHAIEFGIPSKAEALFALLKNFVFSS